MSQPFRSERRDSRKLLQLLVTGSIFVPGVKVVVDPDNGVRGFFIEGSDVGDRPADDHVSHQQFATREHHAEVEDVQRIPGQDPFGGHPHIHGKNLAPVPCECFQRTPPENDP